jgi:hypothetical protein
MSGSWGAQLIGGLNNASPPVNVGGTATGPLIDCPGGRCVFAVAGTFNGATIKLQMLGPDGATLLDVSATQTNLTAPGAGVVDLPPCQVQATVVGGPPSGIFASIARVVA